MWAAPSSLFSDMKETAIAKFVIDQLSVWPMAAHNFRSLKTVQVSKMMVGGLAADVQFNPERIRSSAANTAAAAIKARPCFLCEEHRPKEQYHLKFDGRKGRRYNIQVNPYPIFPQHLVIARDCHVPQSIWHCYVDMLDLARKYQGFTFFYNGPKCGASAPDHMHFQACPHGLTPLVRAVDEAVGAGTLTYLTSVQEAGAYHFKEFTRGVIVLRATTAKSLAKLFYRVLDSVPVREGEDEPRVNVFAWYCSGEWRSMVLLRGEWRAHYFYSEGDDHLTMSIGCADMCGCFIVPKEDEFRRITPQMLAQTLSEVSISEDGERQVLRRLTRTQRQVDVGIMSAKEISFEIISDGAGPQKVSWEDGRISYGGVLYDELMFDAVTPSSLFAEPTFILRDVTIGVDFHWERRMTQKFAGSLRFIVEGDKVTAINRVGVEDYLLSVISSEMKSTASLEFLKAHAVISRSWLMAQIGKRRTCDPTEKKLSDSDTEYIRWFDHDDHVSFDVCADDHCQRYQGLSRPIAPGARKAVDATWGEILSSDGEICDARFSKCCGGTMERFSTCWEDRDYPYLQALPDTPADGGDPFCKTDDQRVLSQVLNDFDLETKDFYEWETRYASDELSRIIRDRSGVDFGEIRDLVPLERGGSGRISRLRIEGSKRTLEIGKELLIRRWLSTSHLKSSAFEVSREGGDFVLRGRGWGHGVGLCQIGAAVMADRGYDYRQILGHYYPGAELETI